MKLKGTTIIPGISPFLSEEDLKNLDLTSFFEQEKEGHFLPTVLDDDSYEIIDSALADLVV